MQVRSSETTSPSIHSLSPAYLFFFFFGDASALLLRREIGHWKFCGLLEPSLGKSALDFPGKAVHQ